jgi:hypothetical protein
MKLIRILPFAACLLLAACPGSNPTPPSADNATSEPQKSQETPVTTEKKDPPTQPASMSLDFMTGGWIGPWDSDEKEGRLPRLRIEVRLDTTFAVKDNLSMRYYSSKDSKVRCRTVNKDTLELNLKGSGLESEDLGPLLVLTKEAENRALGTTKVKKGEQEVEKTYHFTRK